MATYILADSSCYHCGTQIISSPAQYDDKSFCCIGCQSVYQVLSVNNLCSYYEYNDMPGQAQSYASKHYEYLDEPGISAKLKDYTDEKISVVTFYIPAIHCSSCIWLLEHLYKIDPAIVYSRIDFLKKEVNITYKHQELSLRKLVELMVSIGYEPQISLQDVVKEKHSADNRQLIKKIAVAGFCMGNVMLLSFPEYFGLSSFEQQFKSLFGWLNLAFAVPVTFYSGKDFFTSALAGLRHRMVNLDAPLALIIAVLFLRSAFEIITKTGAGFTDTLTGLVFLLLMGRWAKQRTYNHLSFERDYRSYFPLAITVLKKGKEKPLAIEELQIGDRLFIRNNEIIPADSILMKGEGFFDFSFVTGEAAPIKKVSGEIVYAGGRQIGEAIELEVMKPVSQSYLTGLWNNKVFTELGNPLQNFNDSIAKYFSLVTFLIAFSAAVFWLFLGDTSKAWSAFTAVLIVVCPCVLSLSTPFTLSSVLTVFDRNRFYLKNTDVVEQLARIDTIVFDKTGTITSGDTSVSFSGKLTDEEKILAASLARNSAHPLSRKIVQWLQCDTFYEVAGFSEIAGKGISGRVMGHDIRMGNSSFVVNSGKMTYDSTLVQLCIDEMYMGVFSVKQQWRHCLKPLFRNLALKFNLHLLSGDNDTDRKSLTDSFPFPDQMHFEQSPQDKLEYIKKLQTGGKKIMMMGDGLNDAGALKQSDLGVAVTDNINNFNPGCDAILDGISMEKLPSFISQAKDAVKTIRMCLVISASYNLIGVYFAVKGMLAPLTAAVLMPISTITIIIFTTTATRYFARKNKLL